MHTYEEYVSLDKKRVKHPVERVHRYLYCEKEYEEYNYSILGEIAKECDALKISFAPEYEIGEICYSENKKWASIRIRRFSDDEWNVLRKHAKKIRYLYVRGNEEILLPKMICKLSSLIYLHIEGCAVKRLFADLFMLSNLETLALHYTNLDEFPKGIEQLCKLKVLSLMYNNISNIPQQIGELKTLEYLGMNGNSITQITEEVSELHELRDIYFGKTSLSVYPECMKKLKKVERLALWETELEFIPEWICQYTNLKGLFLGRASKIKKLPDDIGTLKKLRRLYIDGTSVEQLPESFGMLVNLEEINLSNTKIKTFPLLLPMKKMRVCDISGLVLERIPQEILGKSLTMARNEYDQAGLRMEKTKLLCQPVSLFEHDRTFIDAYYTEEKIHLNETKVVFLGDGEAGKSHIIQRMLADGEKIGCFTEEATPGISISQKHCQIENEEVCLQIWDFGGQEIMHSMHRFFLTERTLYIIVVNARDNTQDERAKYWLNNIKSFANGCPVILVLNKMDQNPSASINERLLKKDYPQIKSIFKCSALEDSKERFTVFLSEVLETVKSFDSYAMEFPISWNNVKKTLSEMGENYIADSRYRNICLDNGIEDEKIQNWLLDWFHDLGVSFNYRKKNQLLGGYMVLKPTWITNAIYIIIFNGKDRANNGIIKINDIVDLLKNPPRSVEKIAYTIEEVPYILGVMRKFEISYAIDDENEFIPMMCDKNEREGAELFNDENCIEYFMEYEYLPNNVLHKLMIKMKDSLVRENIWLTGMILKSHKESVNALVRMHDNRIEIYVKSNDPVVYSCKEYLSEIRESLLLINQELNLVAEDMVVYKEAGKKEEIKYNDMLIYLRSGQENYFSTTFRKIIPVRSILGAIQTSRDLELIDEYCKGDYGIHSEEFQYFWMRQRNFATNHDTLKNDLIEIASALQGNSLLIRSGQENDRNTYFRDLLNAKGYSAYDQTLNGVSEKGKTAGELDLLIKWKMYPISILEALNLSSLDTNYLSRHIDKIYNYDTWGLECNYLLVYAEAGDFYGFGERYYTYIKNYQYPYECLDVWEEKNNTDMRIYYTMLRRNGRNTCIVHLLIKM